MSVSQETIEMITAAIKSGANIGAGTLVRSKLTNRLVWQNSEHDENDPYKEYLRIIGATQCQPGAATGGRIALGELHAPNQVLSTKAGTGFSEEKHVLGIRKNNSKHDKENWQAHWEILKKAGKYCSFCKSNKEIRDVYLSHNLKSPDGDVTCPILLECVCQCCGKRGHTIAYCPENKTGTSILKMINRHNRI
ncbi:uncharacterized protein LOC129730874 [Wyeomyia smithii]|uniref:uncharacterized protein LOC129730874 n=1 Tax=Wyeomyia smithii TaxID=174621 RepID=UPI002467B0C3|nr:uncharacterized protein LOC129730874 [Wyeomyia smithii]